MDVSAEAGIARAAVAGCAAIHGGAIVVHPCKTASTMGKVRVY